MSEIELYEMDSCMDIINNNVVFDADSSKRHYFDNNYPPSKRLKLDQSYMDTQGQTHESNVSDSLGTSDSPFAESLNSNLCQVEETSRSDYICNAVPQNNKYSYKVTEVYQIGFQVGETDRIYIPNMLDFQDMSYPYESDIILSEQSINDVWNNMTPLILTDEYHHELHCIQTDGATQLEDYLAANLTTMLERADREQTQEMLLAHAHLLELRRAMLKLVGKFWPSLKLRTPFDATSALLDRLIDHLLVAASTSIPPTKTISSSMPLVILHQTPDMHLTHLRYQSLSLIQLVLPQLQLPPEFDINKNLNELINRICSVN